MKILTASSQKLVAYFHGISFRICLHSRPAERGQVHVAECSGGRETRHYQPQTTNYAQPNSRDHRSSSEKSATRGPGCLDRYTWGPQTGQLAGAQNDG